MTDPEEANATDAEPVLFPVATWKLLLMSMVSFGLYEVYWGYKQWRSAKVALHEPMWPLGRAIFLPFSFRFLARDAEEIFAKRGSPQRVRFELLGNAYLLLGVATNCAGWVTALAPIAIAPLRLIPLIAFQRQINRVNLFAAPGVEPDARLTAASWVVIVLGSLATIGAALAEAVQLATR